MSIWLSVVNGVVTVGTTIVTVSKWVWNNASISNIATGTVKYAANTAFQMLEQGLALRNAIPALINKPESRKILNKMAYVAIYDIVPMVGLNFVNNTVQTYCKSTPYVGPILTLVDYGVQSYTIRQGTQTSLRILALDSLGPSAFNGDSERPKYKVAVDKKEINKDKYPGKLKEPLVLLANDGFVGAVSYIPYVGDYASRLFRIMFNGRYVGRLVTPELSERYKLQFMMQESIFALGLSIELQRMLLNYILESTIGMPPYLYYRAMIHLLLLLQVNIAAHMTLPIIESKKATLPFDPFNILEGTCRFALDVVFAGAVKIAPTYFRFEKDATPLIPLTPTLQFMTGVINSGIEREETLTPSLLNKSLAKMKAFVLPPILQGTRGIINDPTLVDCWPSIRKEATSSLGQIISIGQGRTAATLATTPKLVASAVYLLVGVPKKATKLVLMLSQEEDFWNLAKALKAWFERNNIKCEVVLATGPSSAVGLNGGKLIELPTGNNEPPPIPAMQLLPSKSNESPPIPAMQLLPSKSSEPPPIPAIQILPLKTEKDEEVKSPASLLPVHKNKESIVSSNPDSWFTTRRRGGSPLKPTSAEAEKKELVANL